MTTNEAFKIVTDKLVQMVGRPGEKNGKPDFTKTQWRSSSDQEAFLSWLSSELKRDVAFFKAFTGRMTSSRTKKLCDQAAAQFDWCYGPKNAE